MLKTWADDVIRKCSKEDLGPGEKADWGQRLWIKVIGDHIHLGTRMSIGRLWIHHHGGHSRTKFAKSIEIDDGDGRDLDVKQRHAKGTWSTEYIRAENSVEKGTL
ncbi:hypothetical protein CIHG_01105 [Coccidioides immitis H538.4]|uniref:Uncharacterized protein n=1 Tax=Coccidioides immitis H538.4 TaxID=396776 RepID=A0A0J8U8E1_COCIT|nr:hypothetical protein CIHG_01105 [Coccidioides immitis H538.4]